MPQTPTISFDDFRAVDVRVGRLVDVRPFAAARKPAYQLEVDFGPEIGRRSSAS
jgi:tRNA-binding protein